MQTYSRQDMHARYSLGMAGLIWKFHMMHSVLSFTSKFLSGLGSCSVFSSRGSVPSGLGVLYERHFNPDLVPFGSRSVQLNHELIVLCLRGPRQPHAGQLAAESRFCQLLDSLPSRGWERKAVGAERCDTTQV